MTAVRWWVKLGARWLARIDGVSNQIQVFSLGVTAFSTFSLVLQNAGYGNFVVPLGIVAALFLPIYTYLYTEHGVWNQAQRDKRDMSNNFAGPNGYIVSQIQAAAIAAAIKGDELDDEEIEAATTEARRMFDDLRDGVDLQADD